MEILRVVALFCFIEFCTQIANKYRRLNREGIPVAICKSKLKTNLTTVLVSLFFLVFTAELFLKSFQPSISILPLVFSNEFHHLTALKVLGDSLVLVSIISMHFTLKSFKNSLRFGLDSKNLGEFVTTGIFAHSRNPFFISILLLFLGITLVFPTPFFAGIFVLSLISIHLSILREENFMRENYGEEYKEYAQKVKRYF